jgi:hypothetical protein
MNELLDNMQVTMHLNSIDTTKPLGKAVYEYGNDQYISGFTHGLLIGISLCMIFAAVKKIKL